MNEEKIKMTNEPLFVDILQERRGKSDILWASRVWNAAKAYNLPLQLSPESVKKIVLNSYRLKQVLNQINKKNGTPMPLLYNNAKEILDEIGYKREISILRWLGFFVSKGLKKLCASVYVNEAKLLKIKHSMGSNPVLFIPSHKSYCDFILMSYICFTYDMDIPRIAAGMDFQSMAVIGTILRDACAFFMRRSFTYDEMYTAVFSLYVQTLITDGDAPIEFFIEGTRSRTAKSLMPKYGFLSMALKPFFVGLVPDITIVPVSISYDRVLEEVLFAYELLGVPKPKESTKGFIKSLSIFNQSYGNMYIQFGDSLSVKEYFSNRIDRSIHGYGSVEMQNLTHDEIEHIIKLAYLIVNKQKELTMLNCFNLIATILNNNLFEKSEPLTLSELTVEVKWLYSIFKVMTPSAILWPLNAISSENLMNQLKLHKSLIFVSKDQKIQFCKIHSTYEDSQQSKLKGHNLSNSTMDLSIPLLMLQCYVNPCAPFFVGVCFIALAVHTLEEEFTLDDLNKKFKFLYSVFAQEFVFHPDFEEKDFDKALNHSQHLQIIIKKHKDTVIKGTNEKLHYFCINFLSSYIPGYLTVAEFFLESDDAIIMENEVLKGCQKMVEEKLNNHLILHPANLSLDMLMNAYLTFVSMKGVTKIKGKNKTECFVNHNEMKKIYSNLKLFDFCKMPQSSSSKLFSVFIKNNL